MLAIETSGAGCSVAVWRDGALVAERSERMLQGQAARLLPLVSLTLGDAGIEPPLGGALDAVAVTVGPGSFTGIRVGLAAARGFGLALRVPVHGLTSFDVVAAQISAAQRGGRPLLVLLDSKRRDVFAQLFFGPAGCLDQPQATPLDRLAALLPPGPLLIVGDGQDGLPALPRSAEALPAIVPSAAGLARLAAARLAAGEAMRAPEPMYLRPPDVSLPKRRIVPPPG